MVLFVVPIVFAAIGHMSAGHMAAGHMAGAHLGSTANTTVGATSTTTSTVSPGSAAIVHSLDAINDTLALVACCLGAVVGSIIAK